MEYQQETLLWLEELIPSERSLLYCCHLFRNELVDSTNDFFLAGGGVQNNIFIWQISQNNERKVVTLSKLSGHKGAIFAINVNWSAGLMMSVGDDRAVILWQADRDLPSDRNSLDNVQWNILRSLFGHEARVWGGKVVGNDESVITWGEDCSIRFWGRNGLNRGCLSPHTGRSIWCGDVMLVNEEYITVTGGNDGAVVVSKFPRQPSTSVSITYHLQDSRDFPRRVAWIRKGVLIVVTDKGYLTTMDAGGLLVPVTTDIDPAVLRSYCFIYAHHLEDFIFFGNMMGVVIVAKVTYLPLLSVKVVQIFQLHHKVMYIGKGMHGDIVVSLSNGELIGIDLKENQIGEHWRASLDKGWAACWTLWADPADVNVTRLVCGDRDGRLHSFYLIGDVGSEQPVSHCNSRSMGNTCGITCVTWDPQTARIYVGNKVGEIWSLDENLEKLMVVLKNPDILGWACQLELVPNIQGSLIISGFKAANYRRVTVGVTGEHPMLVMEQNCGGGHRDWDYLQAMRGISNSQLAYIQTRAVTIVTWGQQCSQPLVIKSHLHGKEINFATVIGNSLNELVLLTGSEDCSLALATLERTDQNGYNLSWVQRVYGHISSVRCMAKTERLIVTAGGRGQIIFWETDGGRSMRVVGSALLPRLLGKQSDPRVMDLCSVHLGKDKPTVALACSDGSLVLISLAPNNRPTLELEYRLASSCLSNVSFHNDLILACSTNGNIYWLPWRFPGLGESQSLHIAPCALQGMDTLPLYDEASFLVSLGGDDGSVSVISFSQNELSQWAATNQSRFQLAHAGCTVATKWLPGAEGTSANLASLGSDGRIILWRANYAGTLSKYRPASYLVTVTDPHSMAVTQDPVNKSTYWFYLVGLGAQLLSIDLLNCEDQDQ